MPNITPTPNSTEAGKSATQQRVLEQLQPWAALQERLDPPLSQLMGLMGAMPDCPLLTPVYALWSAYTTLIASNVGDKGDWLSYFESECDMGRCPKEVSWTNPDGSKEAVLLDSLDNLAYILTH